MSGHIRKIVIFCGSQTGKDSGLLREAELLGTLLGQHGYAIIYGGGVSGLMGIVSLTAIRSGAKVKGIIPIIFKNASAPDNLPDGAEEDVVEDMMIRKNKMILHADAAIALPGGDGTLDEINEMVVAQQLKTYGAPDQIIQPIIVINYDGFYDDYIRQRRKAVERGFLSPEHEKLVSFVGSAREAIDMLGRLNGQGPVPARNYLPKLQP